MLRVCVRYFRKVALVTKSPVLYLPAFFIAALFAALLYGILYDCRGRLFWTGDTLGFGVKRPVSCRNCPCRLCVFKLYFCEIEINPTNEKSYLRLQYQHRRLLRPYEDERQRGDPSIFCRPVVGGRPDRYRAQDA